jgi:hypothetical protein
MNMRITGFLLFFVGITYALICAAKLPASNATWSDMLPFYGVAVIITVVSLVLLHGPRWIQSRKHNLASLSDKIEIDVIELLQELLVDMHDFGKNLNQLDKEEITTQVDILLNTYVLPFAASRHDVIGLLGQFQGVEVLVAAAQGERLLNRMWSAASDGHKVEAIATYPKALTAFQNALYQSM